jgi:RNA polymerase sigma factor (sigma-70 family)
MTTSLIGPAPSCDSRETESFANFFRRVRAGEEDAACELVRRYEPALRLEIRLRLGDPKLRRLFEPADISQSVLRSFFSRIALGQFELESSERLLGLLLTMARNKIALQSRKHQTLRRNRHREVSMDGDPMGLAASDPSASRQVIGRETLEELRRRLSAEERKIADLRSDGCEWTVIAEELGGTPQARRKQLARAVNRAIHEIGSDEADDG